MLSRRRFIGLGAGAAGGALGGARILSPATVRFMTAASIPAKRSLILHWKRAPAPSKKPSAAG